MNMKINANLIRDTRLRRAWSQEHLAHAAGLGERTVQRIEAAGTASLESIKALAAVLDLSTDQLIVLENVVPEPKASPALPASRGAATWLPSRWRTLATTTALTVAASLGFVVAENALADEVMMDLQLNMDDADLAKGHMLSASGDENEFRIDDELKFTIKPTINDDGTVFIALSLYRFEEGDYVLLANPRLLTANARTATLRVTADSGEEIEFSVTPQIQ